MSTADASELARLRVEQRGNRLGSVVDVICDPLLTRHLGFEFEDGDGRHHFLPRATCHVLERRIESVVPPGFHKGDTLSYYRDRGASWARLRGAPVRIPGLAGGRLVDIRFTPDGLRRALAVAWSNGDVREVDGSLAAPATTGSILLRELPGLPAGDTGFLHDAREVASRA